MALTAGIVGLPNVGKSTLFNAITKAGAEAANYPFATIDPNVGMVEVPDERLQKLTEMITPKKTVPTTFEFTDIAGIVKGASKGEGLGNKFLANIREVDAIVHVVRAFDDENVMREQGREDAFVDPLADIDTINLELILADLESVNKRYARVEKMARTQKDKESVAEFNVLQKIKPVLEDGKSARTIEFTDEEQKVVKGLFLLTTKPVLYVANVDEDVVSEPDSIDYVKQIREFAATENAEVVVISARAEEEISELDDEDKKEFLEAIGLTESGVDKLTRAAYHLLGLGTYFTAGEKEVRAWTFKRGMKAPQAAGIIHSDFEKGFIRAVTMSYEDLVKYGSEKAVKEAGVKVTLKTGDALGGLDKLSLDNQSGNVPDVMMAPYDRVGSLGSDGQLSEVKLSDGAKTDDTTKSLVTAANGKVYGAPAVIESLVMYYNKDLVKDAPKTFADLENLAKDSKYAFAGEDGKTTAFLADWTNFYYTYGLLAGNGAYVFGQNGKDAKDIGLANDGSIVGINYAKSWYEKWPKGMQDTEGAGNLIQTQFQEGKTAAIIDGPWKAQAFKDAKVNYGVATIPTLPNGKEYAAFGGGKAWVIPQAVKNLEASQKFVDFLVATEQQKVLYDKTNEIPANTEARSYAEGKNDELTTAVIKQFKNTQPLPNISQMSAVWDPAKNMLFDAVSGQKDAKTAANDAVTLIKETIKQKFGE
ncbi:maltose/maltodextrin ABC transporter maltose /maltodextrin-binding protein [Streptococcus pneumoniae]|nr:maltose/maltodextrin ABC transporter maltose /maltodextrin-binding protein [Streptococcus pneumoniae]